MIRCGNQKCRKWVDATQLVHFTATGKRRLHPVCRMCHRAAVAGHERAMRAIFPNKGQLKQEG